MLPGGRIDAYYPEAAKIPFSVPPTNVTVAKGMQHAFICALEDAMALTFVPGGQVENFLVGSMGGNAPLYSSHLFCSEPSGLLVRKERAYFRRGPCCERNSPPVLDSDLLPLLSPEVVSAAVHPDDLPASGQPEPRRHSAVGL